MVDTMRALTAEEFDTHNACSVDGCENKRHCRGFCRIHYGRWRAHGNPLIGAKKVRGATTCKVVGCDRPMRTKGFCAMHYGRFRIGSPMSFVADVGRSAHGMSYSPEFRIWAAMKSRCRPTDPGHRNYADRGISVCEEWSRSFETFFRDMGNRPPGFDIDRINNDKGYFKENCRWASRRVNSQNKRVTKLSPELVKKMVLSPLSMGELSKKFGINRCTIRNVLRGSAWTNVLNEPDFVQRLKVSVGALLIFEKSAREFAGQYPGVSSNIEKSLGALDASREV